MFIYHVALPEVWERVGKDGFYAPDGLAKEGFIHCSFDDQVEGVLQRYYQNVENVVILKIDVNKLSAKLVSERSTNDELYPHVYGAINRDAVVEAERRSLR
jgi:uncharacterized protein (DUF952 family)